MSFRCEKPGLDPEQIRRVLAERAGRTDEPREDAGSETSGAPAGPTTHPSGSRALHFHLRPQELIAYLDTYVVGQGGAKAILATKICTHFNRLSLAPDEGEDVVGRIKNNILMVGPTGVGKTFLIRLIARRLGVPFVKADATKFSETGYVGGDVEDLVRELVAEADGDIEMAQHGIIYLDEIDKIAASGRTAGPDVSRTGVQRNLLKLMEETDVDLKSPHDLTSQMESVIQMQRTGKVERRKVNTRDILFVVSGAFAGLEEIVRRRLDRGSMGFHLHSDPSIDTDPTSRERDVLQHVRSEDFISYGFESEFVGRLPVVAVLKELSREDFLAILRSPTSSVILSKVRDFRAYGIALTFRDDALEPLADLALQEQTGARGLVSAVEKVLLDFECRLPSTDIDDLIVSAAVVDHPQRALEELVIDHSIRAFCAAFTAAHDIAFAFSADAIALLRTMARNEKRLPQQICEDLFRDYGHGLRLLEADRFEATPETLTDPQVALNAMIRARYGSRA